MDLNDLMKNPEQIQQLISVLQALLPKDSTKSSTPDEAPAHDNEDGFSSAIKTKRSKKFKQRSASENKFLDMPEFSYVETKFIFFVLLFLKTFRNLFLYKSNIKFILKNGFKT
jgi:hypothetical protein